MYNLFAKFNANITTLWEPETRLGADPYREQ